MAEELHKRGMHYVIITVRDSFLLEYFHFNVECNVDWRQSLKQIFINVSYYILVASLTLMALF